MHRGAVVGAHLRVDINLLQAAPATVAVAILVLQASLVRLLRRLHADAALECKSMHMTMHAHERTPSSESCSEPRLNCWHTGHQLCFSMNSCSLPARTEPSVTSGSTTGSTSTCCRLRRVERRVRACARACQSCCSSLTFSSCELSSLPSERGCLICRCSQIRAYSRQIDLSAPCMRSRPASATGEGPDGEPW